MRTGETTLTLFADEYQVPFLPTEVAAVAGTFGELFSPVMLIAGGKWSVDAWWWRKVVQ